MPEIVNNIARYNAADPEDMRFLIATGAIWMAEPKRRRPPSRRSSRGHTP